MATNAATALKADTKTDQSIEYTVYTFDHDAKRWQKHEMFDQMDRALQAAEKLFNSGKYQKVEVKQKYFEKRTSRNIDMSLKVFEGKVKRDFGLVAAILFAALCGAAAFAVTFFLSNGG